MQMFYSWLQFPVIGVVNNNQIEKEKLNVLILRVMNIETGEEIVSSYNREIKK